MRELGETTHTRRTKEMNLRIMRAIRSISSIVLAVLFVECGQNPDTSGLGRDKTPRETLPSMARRHLQNSWDWFIPPAPLVFGGGDGSIRNQSGAYPWADQNLGFTRETCNDGLYYARYPNQTNWSQYSFSASDPRARWPQPLGAANDHKAGFVCYLLVAQAMKDAGFDINPSEVGSVDWFLRYPVVSGPVQPGDLVLYDFNTPPAYDHLGVITDVSAPDQDHFSVVSSIGVVEHFSYGGAEKRLGIFGSTNTGGDFTVWNPDWEPVSKRIVRPQ
jgi:hypothetical protein